MGKTMKEVNMLHGALLKAFVAIALGWPLAALAHAQPDTSSEDPPDGNSSRYPVKNPIASHRGGVSTENASIMSEYEGVGSFCGGVGDAVACLVHGPSRLKIKYMDKEKLVVLEEHQTTLCYAGRHGLFCEDDEDETAAATGGVQGDKPYDVTSDESPFRQILFNSRIFGSSFTTPGGSIHLETMNGGSRCFSASNAVICTVLGPDRLRLTYRDGRNFADRFVNAEERVTFCYAGRHGLFCDVSEDIIDNNK